MEDAFHGALHEALLDLGAFSSGLFWIWTFIFMRFDKFLACFSPCISHRDFTGSEGISLRTLPDPDFRFYAALQTFGMFFPCFSHRDFTESEGISLKALLDPDLHFYEPLQTFGMFFPCFSHRDFTGSEGISLKALLDLDFCFYAALHGLVAFFMDRFTLDLQAPAHERSPEYFAPR